MPLWDTPHGECDTEENETSRTLAPNKNKMLIPNGWSLSLSLCHSLSLSLSRCMQSELIGQQDKQGAPIDATKSIDNYNIPLHIGRRGSRREWKVTLIVARMLHRQVMLGSWLASFLHMPHEPLLLPPFAFAAGSFTFGVSFFTFFLTSCFASIRPPFFFLASLGSSSLSSESDPSSCLSSLMSDASLCSVSMGAGDPQGLSSKAG